MSEASAALDATPIGRTPAPSRHRISTLAWAFQASTRAATGAGALEAPSETALTRRMLLTFVPTHCAVTCVQTVTPYAVKYFDYFRQKTRYVV